MVTQDNVYVFIWAYYFIFILIWYEFISKKQIFMEGVILNVRLRENLNQNI